MNKDYIEYTLQFPIQLKTSSGTSQTVSILRIGRFKAKHLKLLPKGLLDGGDKKNKAKEIPPHEIIPLIAGLAGITEEEAGELDWIDLFGIAERITEIVGEVESQKIGVK